MGGNIGSDYHRFKDRVNEVMDTQSLQNNAQIGVNQDQLVFNREQLVFDGDINHRVERLEAERRTAGTP